MWKRPIISSLKKGFDHQEQEEICIIIDEFNVYRFFSDHVAKSRNTFDKAEWERIGKFMGWNLNNKKGE